MPSMVSFRKDFLIFGLDVDGLYLIIIKAIAMIKKPTELMKKIIGVPFNKVKGGLSVDLNGVTAFLPGSQIHNKPIKNTNELDNISFKMKIYEPIKSSRFKDKIQISEKLNQIIEDMIIKNPNQWIWTHDRWK